MEPGYVLNHKLLPLLPRWRSHSGYLERVVYGFRLHGMEKLLSVDALDAVLLFISAQMADDTLPQEY